MPNLRGQTFRQGRNRARLLIGKRWNRHVSDCEYLMRVTGVGRVPRPELDCAGLRPSRSRFGVAESISHLTTTHAACMIAFTRIDKYRNSSCKESQLNHAESGHEC